MKNELKHVEDTQTAVSRRFPQLSVGSRQTTEMSSSSSSSHEEDQVAMRRSNSKDLILDLVPAPVETMEVKSTENKSVSQVESIVESQVESIVESQVVSQVESTLESQVVSQVESIVESQVESLMMGSTVDSKIESKKESKIEDKVESKVEAKVEDKVDNNMEKKVEAVKVKSKKAVKKERSQTTMISDVLSSSSRIKSLKQDDLKPQPGSKTKEKKPEICNPIKSNGSKKNRNLESPGLLVSINGRAGKTDGTRSKSPGEKTDRKMSNPRSRSISPAKKAPTQTGEKGVDRKHSAHLQRKHSKQREKTPPKDDLLYKNLNGENKENGVAPLKTKTQKTLTNNVKGGFLAPTKSWLIYMGNQIDLKSRSPSPGGKDHSGSATVARKSLERSPSPRRRIRESSTESDKSTVKSRKSSAGPPSSRKVVEKDPNLPIVKRSNSVKKKPSSINGDVKGSDNIKQTVVSNGPDNPSKETKTPRDYKVSQSNMTGRQKSGSSPAGQNDPPVTSVSGPPAAVVGSEVITSSEATSTSTEATSIMASSNTATSTRASTSNMATSEQSKTESGVERESLNASQVIKKIESQTRSDSSSLLYQDTVSSRMKKVSAEEFHLAERKVSAAQTGRKSPYLDVIL